MKTKDIAMTDEKKCNRLLILPVLLIIVIFVNHVNAQDDREIKSIAHDSSLSLQLENAITHERVFFDEGPTVPYRLRSSKRFEKGVLTGITDSTISFENKEFGNVTYGYNDLAALKIPRHGVRKVTGSIFKGVGAGLILISLLVYDTSQQSDSTDTDSQSAAALVVFIISLPIVGAGMLLSSDKKIYLDKSWMISVRRTKFLNTDRKNSERQ